MKLLSCHDLRNDLSKRASSLKRFITAASTIIIRYCSNVQVLEQYAALKNSCLIHGEDRDFATM
jgi:hypothetical protein